MNVGVLGNYSIQFLTRALAKQTKSFAFFSADYGTLDQDLLNPNSEVYTQKPKYIVIHESDLGLRREFYPLGEMERESFAQNHLSRVLGRIRTVSSRLPETQLLIIGFTGYDNVFGNHGNKVKASFDYQMKWLSWLVYQSITELPNVHHIDIDKLLNQCPESRDWTLVVNADLHYSLEFTDLLATQVIRLLEALEGRFKKCLILDLDNTLWGGTVGDDGPNGIEIGNLGIGKAFTQFQYWLKELRKRGIILAVCSKNQEATARRPFEELEDMVLRLQDISVFVANWDNKADNIRRIQRILNIGFDSMVFLDDNPAEREIVRAHVPEVTVPELPEDPSLYLSQIVSMNLFEVTNYSREDGNRTQQYQQESSRRELELTTTNIEEYLRSLEMKATIESFQASDYERLAQLTQRSNQFNLRTQRYNEAKIRSLAISKQHATFSVKLRDKFGNYGLIGIVVLLRTSQTVAYVDTWLMSCRVLKRGVEESMLNIVVSKCAENGIETIVGEYIPTEKNQMVKDFYPSLGFVQEGENKFALQVQQYSPIRTFIHHEILANGFGSDLS